MATKKYLSYDGLTEYDALIKAYAEATVSNKQDKLTGVEGQVVGFDADGNAVAVDANANIINYDNTASSLSATNVQDAIDEVNDSKQPKRIIVNVLEVPADSGNYVGDKTFAEMWTAYQAGSDIVACYGNSYLTLSSASEYGMEFAEAITDGDNKEVNSFSIITSLSVGTDDTWYTDANIHHQTLYIYLSYSDDFTTLVQDTDVGTEDMYDAIHNNVDIIVVINNHYYRLSDYSETYIAFTLPYSRMYDTTINSINTLMYVNGEWHFEQTPVLQPIITGNVGDFVVIGSDGNVTTKTVPYAEEASF